jgi:hypothetical protein
VKIRPLAQFRSLRLVPATVLLLAAVGCHGSAATPAQASGQPLPRRVIAKPARSGPPALRASELGRVPSVTFGPYLGMRPEGGLVVWAPLEGNERRFNLVPLSSRGRRSGPLLQAGKAPEAIGLVVVRPFGQGYVVVHTGKDSNGESLRVLCVGPDGAALFEDGTPTSLPGRALWVESIPVGTGAGILLYAVQSRDKRRAELWSAPLSPECKVGSPAVAVKQAEAWQAVKLGSTAFIVSVQGAHENGSVSATVVDATGGVKKSTLIAADARADLDLDAVAVGDRAVVAWTNRRRLDPRIETALVDAEGQVLRAPMPLTAPNGEQTLIRLIPPAPGASTPYIAWERLDAVHEEGRRIALAPLGTDGRLQGREVELEYLGEDSGMPEFAAAPRGLAALTLAAICPRAGACDDNAQIGPTFVRFDEQMRVVASEPLRLEPLNGERAELGFGLGCTKDGCFAISALSRAPAPVFATELDARSNAWRAPVVPPAASEGLHVVEQETVARADTIAAFTVEAVQGKDYLAYVTDFDPTTPWARLKKPASDGRYEPLRAAVSLSPLSGDATPATTISLRAESLAGLALAPSDPSKDEALVAWAGLDAGTPQVFLTLVGKGAKLTQRMLTHKKGDLGDVAAVWVDDGWLVAWIDERSGDAEVYAAKVDAKLNRTSQEQRITSAPGTASDLALAYDGNRVRAVWADARGADRSGHSDIYTALLKPRDASRDGDEQRVAETAAHSFSPVLRRARGGFTLAWIERAEGAEDGRLAVAPIDAKGVVGTVSLIAAGGAPRALNLACGTEDCRLAALSDRNEGIRLFAAQWKDAPPTEMTQVLVLAGGGASQVRPALRGDDIFYVDANSEGARLRRIKLKW